MIRGSAILNLLEYEKGFPDGDVSGAFFLSLCLLLVRVSARWPLGHCMLRAFACARERVKQRGELFNQKCRERRRYGFVDQKLEFAL